MYDHGRWEMGMVPPLIFSTNWTHVESADQLRIIKGRILKINHQICVKETRSKFLLEQWEGKLFVWGSGTGSGYKLLKKDSRTNGYPNKTSKSDLCREIIEEDSKLQDYDIGPNLTIILNMRLLGGFLGSSSKGPTSFQDAVKGKAKQ